MQNVINNEDLDIYLHSVHIFGRDDEEGGLQTYCSSWDLPYHLKEDFNGYMSKCGWNVNPDIFFYGKMLIPNEVEDFYIYKVFDDRESEAISSERMRYATVRFLTKIYPDSSNSEVFSLFLYDLSFSTSFIRLYFTKDNIPIFLSKAHSEAMALAQNANIATKETIGIILSKAQSQAVSCISSKLASFI